MREIAEKADNVSVFANYCWQQVPLPARIACAILGTSGNDSASTNATGMEMAAQFSEKISGSDFQ